MRGACRSSIRHRVNNVREVENPDDPQQDSHQHRRHDIWQCHAPKLLNPPRSIHRRRFVQLLWDRLQGSQNHDGKKRDAIPNIRDNDGSHRPSAIRQKGDRRIDQTRFQEQIVNDAKLGIEHPPPNQPNQKAGHRPWKKDKCLVNPSPAKFFTHQEGQHEAKQQLKNEREKHPVKAVHGNSREVWACQYVHKVVQPNELNIHQVKERVVLKRHDDPTHEWIIRKDRNKQNGRQEAQKYKATFFGDSERFLPFRHNLLRRHDDGFLRVQATIPPRLLSLGFFFRPVLIPFFQQVLYGELIEQKALNIFIRRALPSSPAFVVHRT